MRISESAIAGAYLIQQDRLVDERGYFARTFCVHEMQNYGMNSDVVQCSTSFNIQVGTVRGLHYQSHPHEEDKYVRCTRGQIFDVIVDLRPTSSTYGQWQSFQLSEESGDCLYIPKGLAHGFQTVQPNTEVQYMMTESYKADFSFGLKWNDPILSIGWPLKDIVISERDKNLPLFVAENDKI